jgi:hypothetical protein
VTDSTTAAHESGHAVSAWVLGIPLRAVTAASAVPGRLGACYLADPDEWDDGRAARAFDAAVVRVCGQLAEQAYGRGGDFTGLRDRVNWLREDPDTRGARRLIALSTERELLMRGVVATRAAGLLEMRWGSVLALARELHRRGRRGMVQRDVDAVMKATGARRVRAGGG